MARRRKADVLPGMSPEKEVVAEEPEVQMKTITIEVPLVKISGGSHINRRYDTYLDTMEQAEAMESLSRGLRDTGAMLRNGRPVTEKAHVLRWLAEQLITD